MQRNDARLLFRRNWRAGALLVVGSVALLLCFAFYIGVLGDNLHSVVPGRVYRSAQVNPHHLEELIRSYHLRTVISLRGGNEGDRWYRDEAAVCQRLGVIHPSISLRATALPSPHQLRGLLQLLDRSPYPVLFHCRGGADRSGLAATLYLNLYAHVPLGKAQEQQLTWRYGHFRGQARAMDDFFELYRHTSSGLGLREWIEQRYPRVYRAQRHPNPPAGVR
jgi:protein tyrosine phosphatase (PTP) superfamily phosphohydrolase (DUF442 family)